MALSVTKICEYCGKKFEAKRKAAKFCSSSCRTKAYRKRHGIPSPDFTKIITSKMPSENERKLMLLFDELNTMKIEERGLENSYKLRLERYKQALKSYENAPNNWSRENSARRQKEFDEIRNVLQDKINTRIELEKIIEDLQKGIDRESLEEKKLIISADELRQMKFNILQFEGVWKTLFGKPPSNFHMLVSGSPKSGKSHFALQFANYVKEFGSVVYIAVDESLSLSIQRKIIRNDIYGIDLSRAKNRNEIEYVVKKGRYDFVFIDSASQAMLSAAAIEEMQVKFQNVSFINIFLNTKEKYIAEKNKFKQYCDILVDIHDGIAKAKGRYKPYGEYDIFSQIQNLKNGGF